MTKAEKIAKVQAEPVAPWPELHREWRSAFQEALDTMEAEIDTREDTENVRRMKRASSVLRSMLSPAPAAPQAQPADALDVDESPSIHADPLWKWFGLSYASWLTLPRVLMHAMPIDWKADMARLLKRWDETWKAGNLPDTRIQAVSDNGKLTKMPGWLHNYRHPDRAGLENLKEPSARTSQDRAAMAAAQEGGNHV